MIEVLHADALTWGPDDYAAFDVLITDTPYSPYVHENCASVGVVGGEGMGAHDRDLGFAALTPELRSHVAMAAASVKRWSIIFSDFQGCHAWWEDCAAMGAEAVRLVPWIRWSQPQLSGDRPPTGAEAILIHHAMAHGTRGGHKPIAKHWNGPGNRTHYAERCMRGQDKHPAEKGLDLMLSLVSDFSDPGESVVDLCAGSGATAQACRLLGRHCVGLELDATWARRAAARVVGPLSGRDRDRAEEWCVTTLTEAERTPAPSAADGSDVKTWERAQRRIADVARVLGAL